MQNNEAIVKSINEDIKNLKSIYSQLGEIDTVSPNVSKKFNNKSFSFANEQIKSEISRLEEEINILNGKEKTIFSMNITIDLKEGMMIKEHYNDNSEEFVLVKSSDDNELYGVGSTKIIKLSEINQDDYICEDIDFFEKEKDYFEFEKGRVLNKDDNEEYKSKLVEMDEHLWGELQTQIEDCHWSRDDYVDVSVRKVAMSIEDFEKKTNGHKIRFINFRDKVKDKYEELKSKQ